jgi:hypothetical protein
MRCICCDAELTDFEATRKTPSGRYLDMCERCLERGDRDDFDLIEREDLRRVETISEEDGYA